MATVIGVLIALWVIAAIVGLAYLKTPRGRGMLGEFRIRRIIESTRLGKRYTIHNLMMRLSNGRTCQIDHVVITRNGVFVIETKNYSGRIYGCENQQEWTQVLNYGRIKNKLYNPVKQNKTHEYHVAQIVGKGVVIRSCVVFVKGNTEHIDSPHVYTPRGLRAFLQSGDPCLSEVQMETLYCRLSEANRKDISISEHIRNIYEMQEGLSHNICPRCGKKLVKRQGKNRYFMGCSGYPTCKFTKKMDI